MAILVGVLVLWSSTIGLIVLDKSFRESSRVQRGDEPSFMEEPGWGTLVALCIVLNVATLPYYFYSTRRSALWGVIGLVAFFGCFVAMLASQFVVALLIRH